MAVTFDSAGAGNRVTNAVLQTTVSASWTHTISASNANTFVTVMAVVEHYASSNAPVTVSATYGGVTMTANPQTKTSLSGTAGTSFSYDTAVLFFHILNPPTGAQTVAVTAVSFTGAQVQSVTGNSLAYQGVEGFTYYPASGGDGSTTMSGPAGGMKIILGTDSAAAVSPSGYTGRYANGGRVTTNYSIFYYSFGDLASTGSVSGTISPYPFFYFGGAIYGYVPYELYPANTSNVRPHRTGTQIFTQATGTVTFTHTADYGDNLAAVLLVAHTESSSGTVASPATVTYGGQSMTLLGNGGTQSHAAYPSGTDYYRMSLYGITGISPGAATVSVGSLTAGNKGLAVMTYSNVGGFGTALGNNAAITVAGSANGMIAWGGTTMGDATTHFSRGNNLSNSGFGQLWTLSDTVLASDTVTMSGVGVPLNVAQNGWFA